MVSKRRRRQSDLALAHLVAEALRAQAPPRYFLMETYGPDGEIEEAWEGHPLKPDHQGVEVVIITGREYAEPRMDWRERGLVPPRGFHRRQDREEEPSNG